MVLCPNRNTDAKYLLFWYSYNSSLSQSLSFQNVAELFGNLLSEC
jgi:hypothetical protein